jgi:hypothetical protein
MSSNERTHLQQTTAVLGAPGRNNLETRDLTVPRCAGGGRFVSQWPAERKATEAIWLTSVILRVLSTDTSGGTVRSTEDDRARNVTAAHTRWRQQSVRPSPC